MLFENINLTRWKLLKSLEDKPLTPKELSKKTKTTISNASQQLKLLEAYGYVKRNSIGGPNSRKDQDRRVVYYLTNTDYLVSIKQGVTNITKLQKEDYLEFIVNCIQSKITKLSELIKFYFENEKTIKKCQGVFLIEESKNEIHLLVISPEVEFFRQNSKKEVQTKTKAEIVFWSHTIEEIKQGLAKKEDYFVEKTKNLICLIDKDNVLSQIKNEQT